jgi:ATP-binding cassette subfamily F protein 2
MKQFVAKFGAGTRSSQVKSKVKAMEKVVANGVQERPKEESKLSFRFESSSKPFGSLVQFREANFYYTEGEYLYKDLEFGIRIDSRIALVGPNGVGKSTLLKLIDGGLEPTEGSCTRSPHVKVGRFHQHFMEQLDDEQTALEFMMEQFTGVPIEELRAYLGRFGVSGNLQIAKMKTISGGLKSRVIF